MGGASVSMFVICWKAKNDIGVDVPVVPKDVGEVAGPAARSVTGTKAQAWAAA